MTGSELGSDREHAQPVQARDRYPGWLTSGPGATDKDQGALRQDLSDAHLVGDPP